VGNVLVALRCVEIRDKAVSMAFQVTEGGNMLVALRCVEIRNKAVSMHPYPEKRRGG
jgi:hypothetical protein